MPTLSDQLKTLGVQIGAQGLKPPEPQHPFAVEKVLEGRLHETTCGAVFLVEKSLHLDTPHGCRTLHIDTSLSTLAAWTDNPRQVECALHALCFLDIETTGLGGTGCYAFMVGAARYEEQWLHLTQFFMRDPAEEAAMLIALADFVHSCKGLVTFNGKGFDMPVLEMRYRLNRISSPFSDLAHLDLLPLARRLWRDRLASRALGALETHILGLPRSSQDVPGWLIPQMYIEYLHNGDARPLKSVFYHNETDVLSMVALLGLIAGQLSDPLHSTTQPLDLVAMGKMHEALGELDRAISLYRQGIDGGLPAETHHKVVERLAAIYKRQEAWAQAVALWEQAANDGQIYACIELAKYYEHREKVYASAIHWVEQAITRVYASDFTPTERPGLLPELEHRLKRLRRKAGPK